MASFIDSTFPTHVNRIDCKYFMERGVKKLLDSVNRIYCKYFIERGVKKPLDLNLKVHIEDKEAVGRSEPKSTVIYL